MPSGNRPGSRPGFTLIEILVAIGLTALVLMAAAQLMFLAFRSRNRTDGSLALQQAMRSAMELVTVLASQAGELRTCADGVLQVSGGALPAMTTISVVLGGASSSYLQLQQGANTRLTPTHVSVEGFSCSLRFGPGPAAARLSLTGMSDLGGRIDRLTLTGAFTLRR